MLFRSFLTSLRIVIHTLATYLSESCENPWLLEASDRMHSHSPSSVQENKQLLQEVTVLQELVQRLDCQLTRIRHVLYHGKFFKIT